MCPILEEEELRTTQMECLDCIRERIQAEREDERGECWWVLDDVDNIWGGSCGVAWEFICGGPTKNDMKFCPRCGSKVQIESEASDD
jgi:hypothetical protein